MADITIVDKELTLTLATMPIKSYAKSVHHVVYYRRDNKTYIVFGESGIGISDNSGSDIRCSPWSGTITITI